MNINNNKPRKSAPSTSDAGRNNNLLIISKFIYALFPKRIIQLGRSSKLPTLKQWPRWKIIYKKKEYNSFHFPLLRVRKHPSFPSCFIFPVPNICERAARKPYHSARQLSVLRKTVLRSFFPSDLCAPWVRIAGAMYRNYVATRLPSFPQTQYKYIPVCVWCYDAFMVQWKMTIKKPIARYISSGRTPNATLGRSLTALRTTCKGTPVCLQGFGTYFKHMRTSASKCKRINRTRGRGGGLGSKRL